MRSAAVEMNPRRHSFFVRGGAGVMCGRKGFGMGRRLGGGEEGVRWGLGGGGFGGGVGGSFGGARVGLRRVSVAVPSRVRVFNLD